VASWHWEQKRRGRGNCHLEFLAVGKLWENLLLLFFQNAIVGGKKPSFSGILKVTIKL